MNLALRRPANEPLQLQPEAEEHEVMRLEHGAAPLARALEYIKCGWAPIPIPHKAKAPNIPGWPKLRITTETAPSHFSGGPQNIGVLLGEPSGGLTDVDLDAPEAVALAPFFLPKTGVFGRKGKRRSHWIFVCPGAETTKFQDTDGTMLVEIRSGGAQTVFPGSVHVSGEPIEFDNQAPMLRINVPELVKQVRRLAAAALLARHWPDKGGRNDATLALAGALMRHGWVENVVEEFIRAVANVANDEEADDRITSVRYTHEKQTRGEPTTGLPRLGEIVGKEVTQRLAAWFDLKAEAPEWVEEMNSGYFVVNETGKAMVYQLDADEVMHRQLLVRFSFEDLRKLYMNDLVQVGAKGDGTPVFKDRATAWLTHPNRRQYLGGVHFAPGKTLSPDKFNLWQGFAIEPKKGNWGFMQQHIKEVICSGDEMLFDYVMGWLARCVQLPGEQGEVALVLRGGRGVGKGTLGQALLKIFGQHGLYITNEKHLTGNFNAHLRDAVFVFADEAFFAGSKQHESVLKGLITDPFITIEAKYQNAVTCRNVVHLLMASNEDWVVPAGTDERRYCVLEVSNKYQQDTDYFGALHREMDAGGLAAMLHDLLTYDLARFDVRQVPKTNALTDQKIRSLRGFEAWLYNCLQEGEVATHEWTEEGLNIGKSLAYETYKQVSKQSREYAPQDNSQWAKSLREVLRSCCTERRPRIDGVRKRELLFSGLTECRVAFEKHIGAKIDWAEVAED